jgi:P27 family predicted phage terminase small subunit
MGARGPLPKPEVRRRNKRTVQDDRRIPVARPKMPVTLQDEAKSEWRRIVPVLEAAGLLATVDRGVLIRYCVGWADWVELNTQLQATSKLIKGARGHLVRNPLWIMRGDIEATLADLGRQLGLSPVARQRVGVVHESAIEEEVSDKPTAIDEYRKALG